MSNKHEKERPAFDGDAQNQKTPAFNSVPSRSCTFRAPSNKTDAIQNDAIVSAERPPSSVVYRLRHTAENCSELRMCGRCCDGHGDPEFTDIGNLFEHEYYEYVCGECHGYLLDN